MPSKPGGFARELLLARALYRCGDCQGVGEKILREYVEDLRGHLSRHAQAVLSAPSRFLERASYFKPLFVRRSLALFGWHRFLNRCRARESEGTGTA